MSKNGSGSIKERRQLAAAARAVEAGGGRTPEEQIMRLDAAGLVATQERAKLALRIKIRDSKGRGNVAAVKAA